jgi:peptidoglycan/LPS O-acetylase OafA/YrhL
LRGFAALIVMYYHYVPWLMRYSQQGLERSIGKNLCGSVVSTTTRSDLQFYNIPYSGDFGSFGVGVFFLITGFVIPASVDRHTVRSFLHNRLLRLYPCYFVTMVAFAILLPLTAWRLCGHWDSVTLRHLLPNLAFLGTTINPVTWTLDVEVAFVVVTAIMISLGGFNAVRTFLLGGVCLMLTHAGGRLATVQGYEHLARNVTFLAADILYILGGTVCFLIYGRKIGPVAACGAIVGFAVAIHSGDNVIEQASVAFRSMNLSLTGLLTAKWSAFACFSMFLAAGPYWKRHCPFLERLGDISYPLYLVHMLLGLIIFEWLATVTDSGHIALWTAVSASLCCAVIMHVGVEKPLYRAGRHRGPSVGTSTVTPTL